MFGCGGRFDIDPVGILPAAKEGFDRMSRFGSGMFLLRFWLFGTAATMSLGLLAGAGATAQPAPQLPLAEEARLALIDYCVIEGSRMASQYANITSGCRCTVAKIMPQMNEDEMRRVVQWRKPVAAIKSRWDAAVEECR
jgi:hypothetical protein